MRVKVEFNVELEDIPREVIERLQKNNNHREVTLKSVEEISLHIQNGSYLKACDIIAETRKKLSDLDLSLQDAHTIIMGYTNFMSKPPPTTQKLQEELDEITKQIQNG